MLHYLFSLIQWKLYQMVTQNMLRTYAGKQVFLKKKIRLVTRMSQTDQVTQITPYVRIYF